jgi:hypothetical protein
MKPLRTLNALYTEFSHVYSVSFPAFPLREIQWFNSQGITRTITQELKFLVNTVPGQTTDYLYLTPMHTADRNVTANSVLIN